MNKIDIIDNVNHIFADGIRINAIKEKIPEKEIKQWIKERKEKEKEKEKRRRSKSKDKRKKK